MTQTERSTDHLADVSPSTDRQALSTGRVLNQTQQVAEQLHTALSVLATIDQAIGILISRSGGSPEDAAAALREVSRSHGSDLASVARRVVEEVSRRSAARHTQP
jgi:AmiR/NasT family two-component response regulator